MKTFEVIIDRESKHIEVKAKNEEEAETKAIDIHKQEIRDNGNYVDEWIGDIQEVEE